MPFKQAIQAGVGETGSVISSAGLILAVTFAVLASMPIQIHVQVGVITALGLLLDTFVVRPFVVASITLLLGKRVFWPGRRSDKTKLQLRKLSNAYKRFRFVEEQISPSSTF